MWVLKGPSLPLVVFPFWPRASPAAISGWGAMQPAGAHSHTAPVGHSNLCSHSRFAPFCWSNRTRLLSVPFCLSFFSLLQHRCSWWREKHENVIFFRTVQLFLSDKLQLPELCLLQIIRYKPCLWAVAPHAMHWPWAAGLLSASMLVSPPALSMALLWLWDFSLGFASSLCSGLYKCVCALPLSSGVSSKWSFKAGLGGRFEGSCWFNYSKRIKREFMHLALPIFTLMCNYICTKYETLKCHLCPTCTRLCH